MDTNSKGIIRGFSRLLMGLFMSIMVVYSILPNYCNHEVRVALEQIPFEEETEKENEEGKKNKKVFDFIDFSSSDNSTLDVRSRSYYETNSVSHPHWLDVTSPPPELI